MYSYWMNSTHYTVIIHHKIQSTDGNQRYSCQINLDLHAQITDANDRQYTFTVRKNIQWALTLRAHRRQVRIWWNNNRTSTQKTGTYLMKQ